MGFCKLEKDQKTFKMIQSYIRELNHSPKSCQQIDNLIQAEEIRHHLNINHLPSKDQEEILHWIQRHSQEFREYLNSLKLVYLVCHCMEKDWNEITWEEFCRIEDRINAQKARVLDTIF